MAELDIEVRDENNVAVLGLRGDVIYGDTNEKLRRAIREVLAGGKSNLCIDLSHVNYLDSSGVGELISALTAVNRENGTLLVRNPSDKVLTLLEISQLSNIFDLEFDRSKASEA
ncbi:MAG: STAS domain-containing protein [Pyrinomonadaceae bacterium]|nr:STAS domain-containing protein [Pyrinomonadaceae bacterium]